MPTMSTSDERGAIAVVGIGCRLPGAGNVNEYWNLLRDPEPQFRTVPDERWHRGSFASDDPRDRHSAYSHTMALLTGVAEFDPEHYRIAPQRARFLDPQHRLLADLAREAIQDAGWEDGGFDRDNTAVIMALSESGYREIAMAHIRLRQFAGGEFGTLAADADWTGAAAAVRGLQGTALSGLLMNMGASSISSAFDLHGGSYSLDAACSGGLVAVAEAVHALRAGRCRIALAGGAQLVLTPDLLVGLCRTGVVSPTGTCRPFDTRADGFVLGEGAGVLALRPLADALDAGDRVYAVIRGVGLSNDGTVPGGMMPRQEGQVLALRRAYEDAGLPSGAAGYFEAHGTGTTVGDQAEIGALRELRSAENTPAYLGAVKAVVGHSLGASGLAGLIKSILVVQRAEIVPQPEFEPAGQLAPGEAGLWIPEARAEWPGPGPRRAGVSAFGFGGTNVHLVLEQSPAPAHAPAPGLSQSELLLLSARDRSGLARHARQLAAALAADAPPLCSVASTLARRSRFTERLALTADSTADAISKLVVASTVIESGGSGEIAPGAVVGTIAPGDEAAIDMSTLDSRTVEERTAALTDLAELAVSGAGARLVAGAAPLCTLPPSPLKPREYWVLDRAKTAAPARAATGRRSDQVSDARAYARPTPEPTAPSVGARCVAVVEEVARTSAFAAGDIRGSHDLVRDLGFDSLMLREVAANLARRFPSSAIDVDLDGTLTVDALLAAVGEDASLPAVEPAKPGDPAASWDGSTAHMDEFPEVAAMERRLADIDGLGVPSPYFRSYQGNVRNTAATVEREYLSFTSYNYLGLSGHPAVDEAVCEAVRRYGSSVSGSRLLAGERPVIRELERALADLVGTEDCLVLVSGHATNVTAIGHIVGPEDLIVHDSLAHDSILQGCALSGATRRPFAHNDPDDLERVLRRTRSRFRRVLLVVEGVYSMDGDLADLPRLIGLKKRYGALLLVDEAHSIGTMGAYGGGLGELHGVERSDVDLWMGTLSKSLASCGGYLAGSGRTVRWLKHTLPGFVFSAGISPPNAAAALSAVGLLRAEPGRVADLRANSELFAKLAGESGVPIGSTAPESPVFPVMVGDSADTLRLAQALFERGIAADPILHPAVDEQQARLRFFLTSEHREHEIRRAVSALAEQRAALLR